MTDLRPLTPERLEEWLAFFDGPAFRDNPEWGTCYCRCFLLGGGGFERWDAACANPGENRSAMAERIRAGTVDGILAYRDGAAVGWVHYGPTARFQPPVGTLAPVEDGVASIVCFVVAADHRRSGVARALLRGACDALARAGYRAVDARPRPDEAEHAAAEQFCGPLALYLAEGFELVERGAHRHRVRRSLTPASPTGDASRG